MLVQRAPAAAKEPSALIRTKTPNSRPEPLREMADGRSRYRAGVSQGPMGFAVLDTRTGMATCPLNWGGTANFVPKTIFVLEIGVFLRSQ